MELHVEKQYVAQMKQGNARQFVLLYDAVFEKAFGYVWRRVGEGAETEKIVRMVFVDALAKLQNTPEDISFDVWLYSLAKPKVWNFISKSSFPEKQGLIAVGENEMKDKTDVIERAEKMMGKLSLEEREIIRLKFFEQVSDADIMSVLGAEDSAIGTKIYRVLKRASFFLFGETDEKHGVYFGELSSFLERIREMENIQIPEALKLSLRADLLNRIERKSFAVEGEAVEEAEAVPQKPFAKSVPGGSNDPAKIFVEAVKEMREEEAEELRKEEEREARREELFAILDKMKGVLIAIPVLVFLFVAGYTIMNIFDFDFDLFGPKKIARNVPTACSVEVVFEGEFEDSQKSELDKNIARKLCAEFEDLEAIKVVKNGNKKVRVLVDNDGVNREYAFEKEGANWRVKKYAKTKEITGGDEKSGKV